MLAPAFDVRIESADPHLRDDLASRVRFALLARGAHLVQVDAQEQTSTPGLSVSVRVRANTGPGEWLPAVRSRADAADATREALSFLERWGFIRAGDEAQPPRVA